jgi:hypothetical protein
MGKFIKAQNNFLFNLGYVHVSTYVEIGDRHINFGTGVVCCSGYKNEISNKVLGSVCNSRVADAATNVSRAKN